MIKHLLAVFAFFLISNAPALAAPCTQSQSAIQSLVNSEIVSGVPGGITAPTVNGLLTVMNNCYLSIQSLGANVQTTLGFAAGSPGGFALYSQLAGGGQVYTGSGAGVVSVMSLGMQANSQSANYDNSPYVTSMFTAQGTGSNAAVVFPAANSSHESEYYFSTGIQAPFGAEISCPGGLGVRSPGSFITVAAGYSGIDDRFGGGAGVKLNGCGIQSLGFFFGHGAISGSNSLPHVGYAYNGNVTVPLFAIGDSAIVKGTWGSGGDGPLVFAPGTTVTGTSGSPVQDLTMSTNALYTTANAFTNSTVVYRLPAALAQGITTTSGSSTATACGSYHWLGGEHIWSDAFPFGTVVFRATGSTGNQTLDFVSMSGASSTPVNATVTHTSCSGKAWNVPSAVKRRAQGTSNSVYMIGFPFGMDMTCNSSDGNNSNCTFSQDYYLSAESTLAGYLTAANNSGGSSTWFYEGVRNNWVDIYEGGTIGSGHYNDGYNSHEAGNANTGMLMNCSNLNFTTWFGGYWSTDATKTICTDATDPYNGTYGVTANTSIGLYGPTDQWPLGSLVHFGNAARGAFSQIGDNVSDCHYAGGGDDALVYTALSLGAHGTLNGYEKWQHNCASHTTELDFGYLSNFGYGFTNYNAVSELIFTDPTVYTTYTGFGSLLAFPNGFLLNGSGWLSGTDPFFDAGSSAPNSTVLQVGSHRTNMAVAPGGYEGWCVTGTGGSFAVYPCGPVANDTGATQWTLQTVIHTPYTIGTLPTCTAGLQGAVASVSNGTAYGTGTYGSAVSATGAVTRSVLCTNTAGATTYAWAYN